jgi:hypothetical protein
VPQADAEGFGIMQSHFLRVAPGMSSTGIECTIEHYARLGFTATLVRYEFAIVERDGFELHFALKPDHDPAARSADFQTAIAVASAAGRAVPATRIEPRAPRI